MSRAGVVRAEGLVVTTVAATDRILIQQKQTSGPNSGQYLPREVTYANLISGGGGPLTGNSVAITTAQGDLDTSTALLYSAGVLTVGFTAIPGSVVILPTTAANGSLRFIATNNASNFQATVTNAAIGQATTYTIPDPASATATFVLSVAANGTEAANAVTASGFSGVITTSALTAAAGASYAITWTNTKVTTASKIIITGAGGTNTRKNYNVEVVSGTNSATLTIYNTEPVNALNGTIILNYFVIP
jgi:hypothetical protein